MDLFNLNPLAILFIFIAAIIFVCASFLVPLGLPNISDWTAILYAMPLVFLEYNFSIRGNRMAHAGGLTSFEILNLTIIFYFVGLFLVNKVFIGDEIKLKDLGATVLIALGFYVGFVSDSK